jgi:hypothetical protein
VGWALKKIDAGFVDEIGLFGFKHDSEIAVSGIVANAAAFEITVVGGHGLTTSVGGQGLPGDAFGFESHLVIVAWTNGFQMMAQGVLGDFRHDIAFRRLKELTSYKLCPLSFAAKLALLRRGVRNRDQLLTIFHGHFTAEPAQEAFAGMFVQQGISFREFTLQAKQFTIQFFPAEAHMPGFLPALTPGFQRQLVARQ